MRTRWFLSLFAGILLLQTATYPALSQSGQAAALPSLSETERADLRKIQNYLRALSTLRARFVQVTSLGEYAEGSVMVERPGKVRFEYDPPNPVLIVAKNGTLLYYNKELEQASFLPLSSTPLRFIADADVELDEDGAVLDIASADGLLTVVLAQDGDLANGSLALTFEADPMTLRQWEVIDPEGTVIKVALVEPRFGVPIPSSAFDTSDLDLYGLRNRDRGR